MWGLASHGVGDRLRTSVPGFSAVGFSELRQCRKQLIDNHPTKKVAWVRRILVPCYFFCVCSPSCQLGLCVLRLVPMAMGGAVAGS
jgi:hypothetical protein